MKQEPFSARKDVEAIKHARFTEKKSLRAICVEFPGWTLATLSRFLKRLKEAGAGPQDDEVGASDIIAMLKVLRRAIAHAKRKRDTNTILKCSSELRALLALRAQLIPRPMAAAEEREKGSDGSDGEEYTTIAPRMGKGDLIAAVEAIYGIRIARDPRIETAAAEVAGRKLLKQ